MTPDDPPARIVSIATRTTQDHDPILLAVATELRHQLNPDNT